MAVKKEKKEDLEDVSIDAAEMERSELNEDMETKEEAEEDGEQVCNSSAPALNAIAHPLADRKLAKKLYKLIKKSASQKNKLYRGLKNVQTRMRKGGTGLCVLAGDVTPIDIYCHLPIVCEEMNIPYCFVPSKKDISAAINAKRPCIVALISEDDEYKDLYQKCYTKVSKLSC